MNVIVIGLGSMGRRRIRLIKEIDKNIQIYGIDTNEERRAAVSKESGIECFDSIRGAVDTVKPDAAFVCTSPLSHRAIIDELIDAGVNTFTELNLVSDGYERFMKEKGVYLFMSSTFLYRKDIQWIKDRVKSEKVDYIYHTGQYLPDWHPWENYKNFFVGDKRTNGCREIMAIELPWLIEAFGDIESVRVDKDKLSTLDVDYPDNYMLTIKHKNGTKGFVAVDVVSRNPVRRIEIYNEKLHITWDGKPDSLMDYDIENKAFENIKVYGEVDHQEGYSSNIIENAYREEIEVFLRAVETGDDKALYSFEKDFKVLSLIDKIENYTLEG